MLRGLYIYPQDITFMKDMVHTGYKKHKMYNVRIAIAVCSGISAKCSAGKTYRIPHFLQM